jgi:transposase
VAAWIAKGLKLSEILKQLETEYGLHLTYMEVRFLLDDLKVVPKDQIPSAPEQAPRPHRRTAQATETVEAEFDGYEEEIAETKTPAPKAGSRNVSVTVDELTRPGAMASGKVTFSDGNSAEWYLDQLGRLGLAPQKRGYRPTAADVQKFQTALRTKLSKLGL